MMFDKIQKIYWKQYEESGKERPSQEAMHIEQFCDWLESNGFTLQSRENAPSSPQTGEGEEQDVSEPRAGHGVGGQQNECQDCGMAGKIYYSGPEGIRYICPERRGGCGNTWWVGA